MKQPKYSNNLEFINIDMTEYRTMLTKKFKNRQQYEKPNPKILKAYIPGTIRRIYVEEGQEVAKGDRLLVLEAMKMRNYVRAPFNGTIKKIHIEISKSVYKEQLLIEFK